MIEIIPTDKTDVTTMIAEALQSIETIYVAGAWCWAKRERPELVTEIRDCERDINTAARSGDIETLERLLSEWRQGVKSVAYTYYAMERGNRHDRNGKIL
jgi:bisphosphoglycerate-independent phosphoglycerate mutase (AlkP superfamily)